MRSALQPRAEEELYATAAWYDDQVSGLGDDLLGEVDRRLNVLLETPQPWPRWPNGPDVEAQHYAWKAGQGRR